MWPVRISRLLPRDYDQPTVGEPVMNFRQFYVGCLAHASYLTGDGGVAFEGR